MALLRSNFKWKEAGDTDIALYFQQMAEMGRKIPCPCGRGHDDVFVTSSASHRYLENLLLWVRDRDCADLPSAEFISKPIERFEPPRLHKTVQHVQEEITPLPPCRRQVTRLQQRQREALLQTRGIKRKKGSEQWVRDKTARLVRSLVQHKE